MSSIDTPRAVELIRAKPEMFFPGGKVTMAELISKVLRDVGGLSDVRAEVWRRSPFAMVAADMDWLRTDSARFEDLFDRFVSPTPARANSSRAEIFLAATCEGVLAIGGAGDRFSLRLTEGDVPPDFLDVAQVAVRALIWKLTE
jgi:hypothetical protein